MESSYIHLKIFTEAFIFAKVLVGNKRLSTKLFKPEPLYIMFKSLLTY